MVSVIAVPAAAQQPVVLHEYFVPVSRAPEDSRQIPGRASPDELTFAPDGFQLPPEAPPDGPGSDNGPGQVTGDISLDRDTDLEGWLTYYATFDPTVAPWKRVGARDEVVLERDELLLRVGERELDLVETVELAGGTQVFWGSVVLSMSPFTLIPIPSVAPNMSIHRVLTAPHTNVEFLRDSAGNYFARSEYSGLLRLSYLVSAPSSYFAPRPPETSYLDDVPRRMRPSVPASVQPTADEAMLLLGLDRSMSVRQLVWELAAYLRAFRAESFPEERRTEDAYRDILFGGLGVCRHRSFAFVVTLHAWGIPAHYVYNEAHAFVEAFIPDYGWVRIDLGGGAEGLSVLNAEDRVLHAPTTGDSLPTPPGFEDTYSQSLAEAHTPSASRAEEPPEPEPAPAAPDNGGSPADGEPDGEQPADRPQEGSGEVALDGSGTRLLEGSGEDLDFDLDPGEPTPIEPDPTDPELIEMDPREVTEAAAPGELAEDVEVLPPIDTRRTSEVILIEIFGDGFRGEPITIRGRLVDPTGDGLPARYLWAYMGAPAGSDGGQVVEIGTLETNADGWIAGDLLIPDSLPLGRWGVYLVFTGDEEYLPSRSR